MVTSELVPGARLLHERYRLVRLLGTGGMASVWLGEDLRLQRPVAIKVIADSLAADPAYRRRFEREARIAAGLSHPGLVRIYDFASTATRPVLVQEYVPGEALAEILARDAPPIDAHRLARELLDALGHIHDRGIVHRDIKPGNILINKDGCAKLADFGIAHSQDATKLTQTGNVIGTLRYLAPELLRGDAPTPASDLYALGVVLDDVTRGAPSKDLSRVTALLLAADPAKRPESARAASALLNEPPGGSPTAQPRRAARPRPLHTAALGLVAACAVVILALNGGEDAAAPPPADAEASAGSVSQRAPRVEREVARLQRLVRPNADR